MASYWENEQFGEDDDEVLERQRLARIATRCPHCGRNPKLGYPHKDDCPELTAAQTSKK